MRETGRLAAPWGRGPRGSSDTQGVSYDVPVAKQSIKLKQCCCPSYTGGYRVRHGYHSKMPH